jgi:hypothetical protein
MSVPAPAETELQRLTFIALSQPGDRENESQEMGKADNSILRHQVQRNRMVSWLTIENSGGVWPILI